MRIRPGAYLGDISDFTIDRLGSRVSIDESHALLGQHGRSASPVVQLNTSNHQPHLHIATILIAKVATHGIHARHVIETLWEKSICRSREWKCRNSSRTAIIRRSFLQRDLSACGGRVRNPVPRPSCA